MIKNEYVEITGHPRNNKHYTNLGYQIKNGEKIKVHYTHLTKGCGSIIECACDNCSYVGNIPFKDYYINTKGLTVEYFCTKCKSIKIKKTCIEKYGVDNPMKNDAIKSNLKRTLNDKYGVDHYSHTDEYKEKYKETCLIKYGVDNPSKTIEIKKKISLRKFEGNNTIEKYKELISEDYVILNYNNLKEFEINHKNCNNNFIIRIENIYDRLRFNTTICTICNPVEKSTSKGEIELKDFIIQNNLKIEENTYSIIPPLSLDIYIPSLKIALEYNGVYWHSELYKHRDYHLNKTELCNENGIKLLHVWEDDWNYKNEIIKSMILNQLNIYSNKIYARKCSIVEVNDIKIIKKFLNENHIMGYSHSNIKLGLYYNNELVSLMIFGKKRNDMELIRFCSKINYNVIGGASKIFNYFIKNFVFNKIISYSDSSFYDGKLYSNLGFKMELKSKPTYHWLIGDIRKHRFNYNKKNLKEYDTNNKTEKEIMNSLGYNRIWNCGTKKWVYTIN